MVDLFTRSPGRFYRPQTVRLERHFLVADERFGAIQFVNRAKTVDGKDYENLYVFTFRLEAGRIAEGWEHLDSAWFNHVLHGRG